MQSSSHCMRSKRGGSEDLSSTCRSLSDWPGLSATRFATKGASCRLQLAQVTCELFGRSIFHVMPALPRLTHVCIGRVIVGVLLDLRLR